MNTQPRTKAFCPINNPSRQWPVMSPPAGHPHYFWGLLAWTCPLQTKLKAASQNILRRLPDRPVCLVLCPHLWHTLCCCRHTALPCWRVLRWHSSSLISPAFTGVSLILSLCLALGTKYEKSESLMCERRWKVQSWKELQGFFVLAPHFQKRKYNRSLKSKWPTLQATPQQHRQCTLLLIMIKNNPCLCPFGCQKLYVIQYVIFSTKKLTNALSLIF